MDPLDICLYLMLFSAAGYVLAGLFGLVDAMAQISLNREGRA